MFFALYIVVRDSGWAVFNFVFVFACLFAGAENEPFGRKLYDKWGYHSLNLFFDEIHATLPFLCFTDSVIQNKLLFTASQ